jgi:Fe-S cluster assembly protein SufD
LGDELESGRGGGVTAFMIDGIGVESYVAPFDALSSDATAPTWVQSLRRAAFERFASLGFPTTKNEDWHYTSVSPIADKEFTLLTSRSGDVQRGDVAPFEFGGTGLDWHTMVFVNGRYTPDLSDYSALPKGVTLTDLATALTSAPELASTRR